LHVRIRADFVYSLRRLALVAALELARGSSSSTADPSDSLAGDVALCSVSEVSAGLRIGIRQNADHAGPLREFRGSHCSIRNSEMDHFAQ
jgi:hypothetical protein